MVIADNYVISLIALQRFKEAKSVLRREIPVARRVLGDCGEITLSMIVSAICAVIGPINAELNLDCNTAHGAAWVLFPVLLASHALAM